MSEQLESLRRDIELRHAGVVAARETLIEALGDKMCGFGQGPSPEDIRAFKLAQQAEADAKAQLERYLVACSQEVIEHARCVVADRRTRSRDRALGRRSG